MSTVIKVENISKQYRLGDVGTGALAHDVNKWWHKIRGKENPYLKIGEANDRATKGSSDYVWALKDINFEVKQGEVLGIIGRNGAGKSTLLKILSKTTTPTTGSIKIKGRIASLLEVGTGFHPELSGRENIFLNGAILGMTKHEIKSKFDEIVDFAGVERYIDTPVKRYSSGMYVRLAFGVAAHLESEILIVDEVLAVGDAEFQKKCLNKMGEVSKGQGRAVLFVSHNMESMQVLCENGIVLEKGRITKVGEIKESIDFYQKKSTLIEPFIKFKENYPGNEFARLIEVSVVNKKNEIDSSILIDEPFSIRVLYDDYKAAALNTAILQIKDDYGNIIFSTNEFNSPDWETKKVPRRTLSICDLPANFFAEGTYTVLVALGHYNPNMVHVLLDDVISFKILETYSGKTVRKNVGNSWPGIVRPFINWRVKKSDDGYLE
jgi:lipopolysaccharide transport system ATP-binding protein